MKKSLLYLFVITIWVILTGMGQSPQNEVPKPEIRFNATITDDQGISTKLQEISWEGKVYLMGTRGRGTVSIPFEKVKRVVFLGEARGGKKDAQVTLRNGEVVAITFDDENRFYGTTSFGNYRIQARNVKEILFE
ncbi:MAG: hypothetical protein A2073_07765 [Deltaproteobacteria bacterium GWC2_42_11]|nr:MAG: hypothetical protein A2073_07765 [Deltaproteobacteria bacterium GWC2_42_11]HBO84403.1 hypothetical protein [Deltaproteobacteria bacterium]